MGKNIKKEDAKQMMNDIAQYNEEIYYSPRYYDDEFEYRHVNVPKQIAKWMPEGVLMDEDEWRSYGVRQSPGWVHYMIHRTMLTPPTFPTSDPEPHILMFRREKDYQDKYPAGVKAEVKAEAPTKKAVGGMLG